MIYTTVRLFALCAVALLIFLCLVLLVKKIGARGASVEEWPPKPRPKSNVAASHGAMPVVSDLQTVWKGSPSSSPTHPPKRPRPPRVSFIDLIGYCILAVGIGAASTIPFVIGVVILGEPGASRMLRFGWESEPIGSFGWTVEMLGWLFRACWYLAGVVLILLSFYGVYKALALVVRSLKTWLNPPPRLDD